MTEVVPPDEGPGLRLDGFLPYRLAVLSHTVSRAFSSVYADRFGLTIAEWRVLANVGAAGALTAGEIAERSSLDKPKVTRALQRMAERRLIVRSTGRADRRQAHIRLSAAGERMFRAISRLALDWERQLIGALSPEQAQAFDAAVGRLSARAKALAAGW
jgi:DNA-binding MarR family transcriptional regulator